MKSTFVTLVLLLIIGLSTAYGQTSVSGAISQDSTWNLAGSPYIVTGNVTVNSPYTLQVDSGVVVRFQANQGLYVYGSLIARHATFTSSKDTAGGTPVKGDWYHIQVGNPSYTGSATLDTCRVKWGGYVSTGDYASIYVYKGSATVRGCDISGSKNYGVGVEATGSINIQTSNIFQCAWPVGWFGQGVLTFDAASNFTGNTYNGINVRFSTSTGTMYLDTAAVPYVFPSFTVNGTMEIASGNDLKFAQYYGLTVNGALIANAAPGQQIRFTGYADDNVGGDTNADGTATTVAQSYWAGIVFNDASNDTTSILKRCRVTWAGYYIKGGISLYNASPTIDSCSMANNYYGVMMQGVSSPVFSNNDIGTSAVVPIALSFSANPVFSNNSFSASDNQYDAIGILSETVVANSYLPIRSVTSSPNVTYLLLGTVTIPVSYSLTIQPGIVIKSYSSGHRLMIEGKLTAQGTVDSTIVFTSVHDDQYGNPFDTNKNGNLTNPARGNWGGITFEATSDTNSVVKYCVLRYGNTPGAYYGTYPNGAYTEGLITLINASPTIENDTLTDNVYGVYAFLVSKPKINNCVFINSQYTPIAMSVSADPTFSGNSMQNPGLRALGIIGHVVTANGTIKQRTFAGYTNISYVVLADVTINTGTVVNVEPGVVIKMNISTGIYVNGGFTARGAGLGWITFTSIRDDNFGNPLEIGRAHV